MTDRRSAQASGSSARQASGVGDSPRVGDIVANEHRSPASVLARHRHLAGPQGHGSAATRRMLWAPEPATGWVSSSSCRPPRHLRTRLIALMRFAGRSRVHRRYLDGYHRTGIHRRSGLGGTGVGVRWQPATQALRHRRRGGLTPHPTGWWGVKTALRRPAPYRRRAEQGPHRGRPGAGMNSRCVPRDASGPAEVPARGRSEHRGTPSEGAAADAAALVSTGGHWRLSSVRWRDAHPH